MNICSFTNNFDDFKILLSEINVSFDILALQNLELKKIHQAQLSFS